MSKEIFIDEEGAGEEEPKAFGLQFPCDMPMKVIGINSTDFENAVWKIVKKHDLDVAESEIRSTLSSKAAYRSISFCFIAQSRDEVDALYIDLTASEYVKWIL